MSITLIVLLIVLGIGVPIGYAFGIAGFQYGSLVGLRPESLASIPYEAVTSFPLLAIPLFLLMGQLMQNARLADQLFDASGAALSRFKHSIGYVVVATCAFLGSITGSSVATVSAIGEIIRKPMSDRGYPIGYIGALAASAGLLGVLIPPSIPLIIYGSTVNVSVSKLFLAAFAPGLIFVLAMALTHRLVAPSVLGAASQTEAQIDKGGAVRRSLGQNLPALLMPVIVLGSIYGGLVTPTEAAAVGCLYALAITFTRRDARAGVKGTVITAAITSSIILSILAFSSIFNRALTLDRVPSQIAELALSITTDPSLFLLLVTLVMLMIGMVMETTTAVLMLGPLFAPVAAQYGIDPLHFGILMVTTIEIGLLTPPMAANVFVAMKSTGAPFLPLVRHLWPFMIAIFLVLLIIVYVPALTTWPGSF